MRTRRFLGGVQSNLCRHSEVVREAQESVLRYNVVVENSNPQNEVNFRVSGTATSGDYVILKQKLPSPSGGDDLGISGGSGGGDVGGEDDVIEWDEYSGSSSGFTIPEGDDSTTLRFRAVDDNLVEALSETLTVSLVTAGHGLASYEISDDFSDLFLELMDNNSLELQSVTFKDNLALKSDPDSSGNSFEWQAGPHWQKDKELSLNPATGYVPVAYSSLDTISAVASWTGNVEAQYANSVYAYFEWIEKGDEGEPDKISQKSAEVNLVLSNGKWVFAGDEDTSVALSETIKAIQGQMADYRPDFQLQWKIYVKEADKPQEEPRNAGVSTSCLYVTYGNTAMTSPPEPAEGDDNPHDPEAYGVLYHSVVHIGCVAAKGIKPTQNAGESDADFAKRAKDLIFNAIWSKFASAEGSSIDLYSVTIVDGAVKDDLTANKLFYYGILTNEDDDKSTYDNPTNKLTVARKNEVGTTVDFLKYKDGTCQAWAHFFIDIVNAQGLGAEIVKITPTVTPGSITYLGVTFTPKTNGINNKHADFHVNSNLGIHHEQSSQEVIFNHHYVVKYNNNYYDTSYGTHYGSGENNVAQNAIAKSFVSYRVTIETNTAGLTPPAGAVGYVRYYITASNGNNAVASWIDLN